LNQRKNPNVLLDFFGINKFLISLKSQGCGWGNPAWFPISS
jgi:hypothetical protein